jgi:hypothetical protein
LGDEEFNFGREFLEENLKKTSLAILSCNIFTSTSSGMKRRLFRPYMIKEFRDIKIGIIGVTTVSTREKATGLEFIEPKTAVQEAVKELCNYNIDIIIVLSHLGESEDLNLINDVDGIDILIIGHSRAKEEPFTKIGRTLILRPSWQGRKLGKLSLIIKDKKIVDYKVEDLRLSEQIKNDPQIISILPRCFSDNNCKEGSRIGVCHDPGTLKSRCEFGKVSKVSLLVITSKQCRVCDTQRVIRNLKTTFANLTISYLYYPKPEASKLIDDFGIDTLPVYLLGKEARQEKGFNNLRDNLESKGDFYLLKPQFSGISYFLKRPKLKDRLDLFISLYDKDTPELLAVAKVFRPNVHFLVTEEKNSFTAARGNLEVEEDLRSVCVQKYYPQSFYNYISCRGKFINSSWWEDCLENLDKQEIKTCAKGEVGRALLKENIRLNQELEIMRGPTYLLDNQEVFSLHSVPKREELEAIIQK